MSGTEREEEPENIPECWATLQLLYSGDEGPRAARTLLLGGGSVLLGRSVRGDSNIRLASDRRASEVHAEIITKRTGRSHAPKLLLQDRDSSNGTFVNGRRVHQTDLKDGDVVRIGDSFVMARMRPARVQDVSSDLIRGTSPAMAKLRCELASAALRPDTVLLLGESGVGKDIAAQWLHRQSGRPGRLVAMNCAAIPNDLAESQLFGHEVGAFSGAQRANQGFFRAAHRGTLFLDEIIDMPMTLQPKLLRALEEQAITPVGSTVPVPCDVRVIAATNGDVPQAVADQRFRGELFARLRGIVIRLPPLRERREDILPLLYDEFPDPPRMRARLVEALLTYHYPYNVRELKQMARALRLHLEREDILDLPHILDRFEVVRAEAASRSLPSEPSEPVPSPTRDTLVRLLEENGGIVARVAAALNRSHRHIRRLLEKYGIDPKAYSSRGQNSGQPSGPKVDPVEK